MWGRISSIVHDDQLLLCKKVLKFAFLKNNSRFYFYIIIFIHSFNDVTSRFSLVFFTRFHIILFSYRNIFFKIILFYFYDSFHLIQHLETKQFSIHGNYNVKSAPHFIAVIFSCIYCLFKVLIFLTNMTHQFPVCVCVSFMIL